MTYAVRSDGFAGPDGPSAGCVRSIRSRVVRVSGVADSGATSACSTIATGRASAMIMSARAAGVAGSSGR